MGNIGAHWFTNGGGKPQQAASKYPYHTPEKHYVYKVTLDVQDNSIVGTQDDMVEVLKNEQLTILENASSTFTENMTVRELNQSPEY